MLLNMPRTKHSLLLGYLLLHFDVVFCRDPEKYDLPISQLNPIRVSFPIIQFLISELIPMKLPLPMYVGPFILQKSSIVTPSSIIDGPSIMVDLDIDAFGDTDVLSVPLAKFFELYNESPMDRQ